MMQVILAGAYPAAGRLETSETALRQNETAVMYVATGVGVIPAQLQAFPEQGTSLGRLSVLAELADSELSAGAITEPRSSS
jgi:hypothetical protein